MEIFPYPKVEEHATRPSIFAVLNEEAKAWSVAVCGSWNIGSQERGWRYT